MPNAHDLDNFMSLYSYPVIDTSRPHYGRLSDMLENNNGQWTILLFHHIFSESAVEWKTFARYNVKDTYSLTPLDFERYIRLLRNYDYAAGSIRGIGNYLKCARNTDLDFSVYDDYYTIGLRRPFDGSQDSVNLSIELRTPWKYIRIDGSTTDGIYEVGNGNIIFEAAPGSTVVVRNLDIEDRKSVV